MTDLYLERIGIARPTIVERDNNGKIERLESIGLDMASLVAFWRRCFDLNGLLFEKITLHCKTKDFYAMGQRTLATRRSVRELLAEQGVECVIDDEWFKDREFKNEQFERNMKNVLEIEKKNAVKEFAEKLKEEVVCNLSCKGTAIDNAEEIKACMTMARQLLYRINRLLNEDYGFDEPLCARDQFKVEPELIKKYKIDELFKEVFGNDK